MSNDGYVSFGEVARRRCGMQAQYCSRYVDGRHDSAHLGKGLRFRGNPLSYHFLEIHADDVDEFVRRVIQHRRETGQIA